MKKFNQRKETTPTRREMRICETQIIADVAIWFWLIAEFYLSVLDSFSFKSNKVILLRPAVIGKAEELRLEISEAIRQVRG